MRIIKPTRRTGARRVGLPLLASAAAVALVAGPPTASDAHQASQARHGRECFGHHVTMRGDASDEDFVGTQKRDVIHAGPGNDSIVALGGDDLLCGGAGRDQIDAGQGIRGGTGDDRLRGGGGADELLGYGERDRIWGGPGNDALNGSSGRDKLYGQRGNDTLTGDNPPVDRRVHDVCRGGPGRDRRYFC